MVNEIIPSEADLKTALRHFLDENGRLKLFPSKRGMRITACHYLKTKLEKGKIYTESEINDLIDEWTLFHDPATLRREMYDAHCVDRNKNGARYWLEEDGGSAE